MLIRRRLRLHRLLLRDATRAARSPPRTASDQPKKFENRALGSDLSFPFLLQAYVTRHDVYGGIGIAAFEQHMTE